MSVPVGRKTTPPRAFYSVSGHKAGQTPHARGNAIHGRHVNARISYDFAEPDSAQLRIAKLLEEGVFSDEKESAYEQRLLRVTIQQLLLPLESLTSARDVAQVFADVVQGHAWLYECAQVLHRDISMSNIMYRVREDGHVYGVLNDFDLTSELEDGVSSTSRQCIGTPPFMASDLLVNANNSAPKHLYRHDLESFLHVMALFISRFTLQVAEPSDGALPRIVLRSDVKWLPLESWFDEPKFSDLAWMKENFIIRHGSLEYRRAMSDYVSPSFQDLTPWLHNIRLMFHMGLTARANHHSELHVWEDKVNKERMKAVRAGRRPKLPPMPIFDDATLGNKVSYTLFMADVGEMTFEKPIVIKYEPTAE